VGGALVNVAVRIAAACFAHGKLMSKDERLPYRVSPPSCSFDVLKSMLPYGLFVPDVQ
jgi:hypothetical protein